MMEAQRPRATQAKRRQRAAAAAPAAAVAARAAPPTAAAAGADAREARQAAGQAGSATDAAGQRTEDREAVPPELLADADWDELVEAPPDRSTSASPTLPPAAPERELPPDPLALSGIGTADQLWQTTPTTTTAAAPSTAAAASAPLYPRFVPAVYEPPVVHVRPDAVRAAAVALEPPADDADRTSGPSAPLAPGVQVRAWQPRWLGRTAC